MSILLGVEGGFVVPPAPPPVGPPRPDFILGDPLVQTWLGWDGSIWRLTEPQSGVAMMPGVRGLTMPEDERYKDESPAAAGSRFRGSRTLERECFWPLSVFHDGTSQDWVDWDRALWRTLQPRRTGLWTVQQPNGVVRMLRCRFSSDGGHAYDLDPLLLGWTTYGITLTADDPYWRGEPISRVITQDPPEDFFGGDDSPAGGPPFVISADETDVADTIDNPGDVPAYLVFLVEDSTGPVSVGVNGKMTDVPFATGLGHNVKVDTNPRAQTATDDFCRNRSRDLTGAVSFAPVPPGVEVPLDIRITGSARVTVTLTPGYYRAW